MMAQQQSHAMLTADIEDRIEVMRLQEVSAYASVPLPPFLSDANHVLIIKWFYKIVDHFDFKRELVEIALSYLTRFTHKILQEQAHYNAECQQEDDENSKMRATDTAAMEEDAAESDSENDSDEDSDDEEVDVDGTSSSATNSRRVLDIRSYRLAALTSLYLAVKLFSNKRLKITMAAALSRGEFSAYDIADTEQRMLQVLEYRMNPPTAIGFLHHFLVLLGHSANAPNSSIQEAIAAVSNHLVELSMFRSRNDCNSAANDHHNSNSNSVPLHCQPSTIALASLLNALNAHGIRQAYPPFQRAVFLQNIYLVSGMSCKSKELQTVRVELNQLYRENYRDDFGSAVMHHDSIEERMDEAVVGAPGRGVANDSTRNSSSRGDAPQHDERRSRRRDGYTEVTP